MKACVITKHGGPEAVAIRTVPDPVAADGEALVCLKSAALNHLDIRVRDGGGRFNLPMPHVLGSDGAGVVVAVGGGVSGVSVGDEVVIYPGLSCGVCEFCQRGEHSECVRFAIIGASRPGTFAGLIAVPAVNLAPKPDHLSFEEAAPLMVAHLTAWRMLMTRGQLRPGETVLIHGIGGGVALAALQLAKLAAAQVIVTSSSDVKLARARGLGADHQVNYRSESVTDAVKEITGGRGVDLVIDSVGGATWPLNFDIVRRGGRVVLCGVTAGANADTNLAAFYWNQLSLFGSTLGSREDLRQMLQAVSTARLTPVICATEPLDRAKEAMALMEKGGQFGKIVLRIS